MSTFARYDDTTGAITSLTLVEAPSGVSGGVIPEPGRSDAEIADLDLALDEEGFQEAEELIERFIVIPRPSGNAELSEVRKPGSKKG